MAEYYGPFNSGVGSTMTAEQWRAMARMWAPSGVDGAPGASSLQIVATSGAAVLVKAGACWVDGHAYMSDADQTVALAVNSGSQPRVALIVAQLNPATPRVSIVAKYGTAAASPVKPSLTQAATGVWEIALGSVIQPAGSGTPTPGSHTDLRLFTATPPTVMGAVMTGASTGKPLQVWAATGVWLTNQFGQFAVDTPFADLLVAMTATNADKDAFNGDIGMYAPTASRRNAQGNFSPLLRCYRGGTASGQTYVRASIIAVGS